jgi:mRNA (guanine-N7-)-methyltransferase
MAEEGAGTPSNVTAPRKVQKRKRDTPASRTHTNTPNAYARRTPPPEPKPISDDEDERQLKRPGGLKRPGAGARINRERQQEVEEQRRQREEEARRTVRPAGFQAVADHYNAVPERGREWRSTESQIKGLRSLNNWIKSTLIQKFSAPEVRSPQGMAVLDMACGKGGDLGKWEKAPVVPSIYVGCDIADVSIEQAKQRYNDSQRRNRHKRPGHMHAEFYVHDTFGKSLSDIPVINQIGFNPNAGPGPHVIQGGMMSGGFDVVSMMFALHYSFESEELARGMLRNVAGALKKGGKFIGVMPNSDIIASHVAAHVKPVEEERQQSDEEDEWDPEKPSEPAEGAEPAKLTSPLEWGNSIYSVKFAEGSLPTDGVFRPPYGWKYNYFLQEAVEAPEYVVPWEGFRALAEEYGLELLYRKGFREVFEDESEDRESGILAERMGVMSRDRSIGRGGLLVSEEEMEAASFYHAFCFYKT